MTNITIQGKKITRVQVSNSLAGYYSQQAKGYRDEAKTYATLIIGRLDGLDELIENAKADITSTADLAVIEVNEAIEEINTAVSSAKTEIQTYISDLMDGIDKELKQLIGEE